MARARRRSLPALGALLLALTALPALTASASPSPEAAPLPAELESIRAAEAAELYGDPAIRPMEARQVSVASLGDSEISGEGVGNYEAPTNGPDNWCHRSHDAAIHRTGIPADVTYNFACSGASTQNVRIGGSPQYGDELVQSDSLAIAARNTRVDTIVLVVGANDDLRFGPVITDCVVRWFTFQGACGPSYDPGWQDRVDALRPKVTATITDLHTVMADAGYVRGDYSLVVVGYPGPLGPDIRDNPDFPGKLFGGCTGYDSDATWARDRAVPLFQQSIRAAASDAGATYLDLSRLFHGHEVCMDDTWARGLTVDLGATFPPDENSVRQSFHPNYRGHGAFASCLTQLRASGLSEASCADPASTGEPVLFPGAWDDHFAPLTNAATGQCVDASGASSANGTAVLGWDCHGARNQGWWLDPERGSVHIELSHDRCLDVPGADYSAGTELIIWNCHGGTNQTFTHTPDATLSPTAAPGLCVTQTASRAPLTLQPCDGSATQRFT